MAVTLNPSPLPSRRGEGIQAAGLGQAHTGKRHPALNKPRAMLVDLDDTIIDYRSGVDPCWRLVCADAADRVPGLDADEPVPRDPPET